VSCRADEAELMNSTKFSEKSPNKASDCGNRM